MSSGIDRLHALPRFSGEADASFKPGLERMHALLDAMGNPEEAFPSIHVAGTNGKGSTASMIAAIASTSDRRVGLHTSPELTHVTELMRVNGRPAAETWLDEAVHRHSHVIDHVQPSFFEATVAFSFLYFAEQAVDLAVVEVGLGGRLDATNVLDSTASVITSIDLEHTNLLGDTLSAIAREKAGIIKPGRPCVTGVTQDEALITIRAVAAELGAAVHVLDEEGTIRIHHGGVQESPMIDLRTPDRLYERLTPSLPGAHQFRNAWLAVRALEVAGMDISPKAVREGLAHLADRSGLRGRMEVLSRRPLVIADVAHNPSSLAATLTAIGPSVDGQLYVGLALARDKDAGAIAQLLTDRDATIIPLQIDASRLRSADALTDVLRHAGARIVAPQTVEGARRQFERDAHHDDALLLTGSHHVVREAIEAEGAIAPS
ncbi:dihydrofolate synthase [Longibacter salinarum]|uniref:Dihydrofolate synthase/folylpolyglutamate synthase n=1 Tax=Longibacter salinarum TaxID=1850348 RepID=A0A2A8CWW8_9BACT|nr:folylpolyglutamate synthase/dihydrofolate synthase family protein [Longibacter salinarum]PEN13110.1 dihydrofolate synthase [Longibacter salinarum]